MAKRNANFSKVLRALQKELKGKNGKRNRTSIEEFADRGQTLIFDDLYEAASSKETCEFIETLVKNDLSELAHRIVNQLIDVYPQAFAGNKKLGKALNSLIQNGEALYVFEVIESLTFGRQSVGPSVASASPALSSNDSIPSTVQQLLESAHGEIAGLTLHRLAIHSPGELARNTKLGECLASLAKGGQSQKVEIILGLILSKHKIDLAVNPSMGKSVYADLKEFCDPEIIGPIIAELNSVNQYKPKPSKQHGYRMDRR